MDEKPPSYQWYPRDFRAEPAVDSMTWEQRGRYRWALDASWLTETYGVATEDCWREWMHYSPEEWSGVRAVYAPCFKISVSGIWTQKRLAESRASQLRNHEKAVRGGVATQEKRRASLAALNPGSSLNGTLASASASASESESKEKPNPRPSASASVLWDTLLRMELPDFLPREAWTDFVNHRRSLGVKGKLTERAARLTISELQGLNASGHPPGPVISQSVTNNWKGVFPIKNGVPNSPVEAKPKTKRWTCINCGKTGFSDDGGPDFRRCENCEAAYGSSRH